MKNSKRFLAVIAALCLMLTGCGSVEKPAGDSSAPVAASAGSADSASHGIPSHIKKQLAKNLSADADVVVPKSGNISKADVLNAKYLNVSTDTLVRQFLLNQKIERHVVQKRIESYQASGGLYLNNGQSGGFFDFTNSKAEPNIHYSFYPDQSDHDDYNADKFSTTSDLPFETRTSAFGKLKKIFSAVGLNLEDQYTCYSLDYQTLKAQQDAYVKREESNPKLAASFKSYLDAKKIKLKSDWSQDDNCYYFAFQQSFNGIPVTQEDHGDVDKGTDVPGTRMSVLYSKNGICDFNVEGFYQGTGVQTKDAALIGLQGVLDALKSKYESIILSDPIVVKKLSLNYVAVLLDKTEENFKLTPAWVVTVNQITQQVNPDTGKKFTVPIPSVVMINAVTGKEIT